MSASRYNLFPHVPVAAEPGVVVTGWDAIANRLRETIAARAARRTTLVVECYHGVDEACVLRELAERLQPAARLAASDALRTPHEIDSLVAPSLGDGDPVFGRMNDLELAPFFDGGRLAALTAQLDETATGLILVAGCGARLIAGGDILVYADLSRREAQLRQRRGEIGNLGADNCDESASLKYKRAFFVDWRVCDRWKRPLIAHWDFVLDTHDPATPKLAGGDAVRRGLHQAARQPFRVVPWFDPAPWGGRWLREHFGLDGGAPNYGWGFDCVPEENSLRLGFGGADVELPALDLVFDQPRALLGDDVFRRFGADFPIRFDFLDTMGGGNLSFQVHPTSGYIRRQFGLGYTQDESYYVLAAEPGAVVYLGLKDGIDRARMMQALQAAEDGGAPFPADDFASQWPARQHDHFLIPAGTVHCSGRNALVLEISATPYIFTFKLWDWGRLGLDGRPRPIHLEHGAANIQWERARSWTRQNLIGQVQPLARGPGWTEERTGLHETQFIETRRHWFTSTVAHDTRGGVNVLNLVEGDAAVVESADAAFAPFEVNFAETFIVPAAVGAYTISPRRPGARCATIKAFVRSESTRAD
ncbi:MAG: class I mannose-6-phosphate isomerase [Opitutaceae bacterium]|nr:class I mannose-6-phosphate isomerase [Opitutaceae bacterium]